MICPNCRSTNDDEASDCFTCGHTLRGSATIRRGSIIAGRYAKRPLDSHGAPGRSTPAPDAVSVAPAFEQA